MSQNERDTHFAGFAKLLRDAISDLAVAHHEGKLGNPRDLDEYERLVHLLIAQRAYDLARHIVWEAMGGTPNAITIILSDVPDLTEWPRTTPHHEPPGDQQ